MAWKCAAAPTISRRGLGCGHPHPGRAWKHLDKTRSPPGKCPSRLEIGKSAWESQELLLPCKAKKGAPFSGIIAQRLTHTGGYKQMSHLHRRETLLCIAAVEVKRETLRHSKKTVKLSGFRIHQTLAASMTVPDTGWRLKFGPLPGSSFKNWTKSSFDFARFTSIPRKNKCTGSLVA